MAECVPPGIFAALYYCDLVTLRKTGTPDVPRDVILDWVKPGRKKSAADAAAPYFRPARTVLHDRIREVPNFTGRKADLDAIDKTLWRGDAGVHAAAITQGAVHGGGGVGKSTLA